MKRLFIFVSFFCLNIFQNLEAQSKKPIVRIKGVSFQVELARTAKEWEKGLMYRDDLKKNQGMLFWGSVERPQTFWMKNTPLSLDIIFIDSKKRLVSVQKNAVPFSETPLPSAKPAMHVLEILAGQAAELELKPGDSFEFINF